MYQEGEFVKVSGIVQEKNNLYSILNPNIERVSREHIYSENSLFQEMENSKESNKELIPVYKETKGVSSLYLNSLIKRILSNKLLLDDIQKFDPIPKKLLAELHLPTLDKAYLYIHLPKAKNIEKVKEQILVARKRFSFQEIFYIQLIKQKERAIAKNNLAYKIETKSYSELIKKIEKDYGYKLTKGQLEAVETLSRDLAKSEPMGRLLEGDVGSGKTLVAEILTYLTTEYLNRDTENGKRLQVAIMAPTEILATQHFESFIEFFKDTQVEIGLLTSKICKKYPSKINPNSATKISKAQLKK